MEEKEQKQFYVTIKGEKIHVTEEVYRAYIRPDRAERRARRRNWRCIIKEERYGLVRCKNDCNTCPYALAGNTPTGVNLSYEAFCDGGLDMPSDLDLEADLMEQESKRDVQERIQKALLQLNERQQFIVRAIYFDGKSKTNVAQELGMNKSALSMALRRILLQLKKILQEN